jgi:hypothetical protein
MSDVVVTNAQVPCCLERAVRLRVRVLVELAASGTPPRPNLNAGVKIRVARFCILQVSLPATGPVEISSRMKELFAAKGDT